MSNDFRKQRGQVIAETCKLDFSQRALVRAEPVWARKVHRETRSRFTHVLVPRLGTPRDAMQAHFRSAIRDQSKGQSGRVNHHNVNRHGNGDDRIETPDVQASVARVQQSADERKDLFQTLLSDLCKEFKSDGPRKQGRPSLSLADAIFACCFKVYSTVSGRRFMSDLREATRRGYLTKTPHYNSIFNYLENPNVTEILRSLITRTALPLKAVELDFACDSSGFMTSRFDRWFDQKYGAPKAKAVWVKAHLMCGVKTNVVTAVEIHEPTAHDAPLLPALVDATAANFNIREVSADKGYSSRENHNVIAKHNATPYIAFKSGTTGGVGGLFEKMWHYFSLNREEFLRHYHKRSNVESTFAMIKAKFGDSVRSKTDTAMKNEVLAKIVCHNIVCVIHEMYELGIKPEFLNPPS